MCTRATFPPLVQFRTPFDHELLVTKEDKAGIGRQVIPSVKQPQVPLGVAAAVLPGEPAPAPTKNVTWTALRRGTAGIPHKGDSSVLEYHEKLAFIQVRSGFPPPPPLHPGPQPT